MPTGPIPLGTDNQGRDVLSAIMYGMRISLLVGLSSVLLAIVIGIGFGLLAGYAGGIVDAVLMRVADVQLTFPSILTALLVDGVVSAALPRTMREALQIYVIIFAIGVSLWPNFARTVRGSTLVERNKDYVMAARVIGVPSWRIMLSHVLPNVIGPVHGHRHAWPGHGVITEATLSFLGVGLPPTQPSLGTLIRFGNDFLFSRAMVGDGVPRPGAGSDGAGDQSAGRLAARRTQSEAALMPLLEVRDLVVEFPTRHGVLRALDRVSFGIDSWRDPGRRGQVWRRQVADRRGDCWAA